MQFTEADHAALARLFGDYGGTDPFDYRRRGYPGYHPTVREAPNGDTKACAPCQGSGTAGGSQLRWVKACEACNGTGRVPNVDAGLAGKRYLHVAPKYNPPQWAADYYDRAFAEACRVATALGVPAAYRPHEAYGALRVLEYPSAGHAWRTADPRSDCTACGMGGPVLDPSDAVCPALAEGAGTVEHTDFDLFTIVLWRSTPGDLERTGKTIAGFGTAAERLDAFAPGMGLHIGEIGELVGLGPATPHRVPARPYAQKSIVYFAIPDHAARLPTRPDLEHGEHFRVGGETVGEWLAEREKRSRYEAGK